MIGSIFLIPLREAGRASPKAAGGAFAQPKKYPIRHAFRVPPSPAS